MGRVASGWSASTTLIRSATADGATRRTIVIGCALLERMSTGTRQPCLPIMADSGRGIARARSDPVTTLRIGIASYDEMKGRTLAVARGERRIAPGEPSVWF